MTKGRRGGRAQGQRNRRTTALMELATEGESPVAMFLRLMRDEGQPQDVRILAARAAAPYCHPRPTPDRFLGVDLPHALESAADLLAMHAAVLKAVASGEMSIDAGQQFSAIVQGHIRLREAVDLEARIARLEGENRL